MVEVSGTGGHDNLPRTFFLGTILPLDRTKPPPNDALLEKIEYEVHEL